MLSRDLHRRPPRLPRNNWPSRTQTASSGPLRFLAARASASFPRRKIELFDLDLRDRLRFPSKKTRRANRLVPYRFRKLREDRKLMPLAQRGEILLRHWVVGGSCWRGKAKRGRSRIRICTRVHSVNSRQQLPPTTQCRRRISPR